MLKIFVEFQTSFCPVLIGNFMTFPTKLMAVKPSTPNAFWPVLNGKIIQTLALS